MACIKWPQPFACLFWMKCHPSKAWRFPKRSLGRNSRVNPPFSPPPNYTLWIPWLRAHLPCISWVQVGDAPALVWALLSSVFVFLYSHAIPAILVLSHSTTCAGFVLISHSVKGAWVFGLVLLPFLSSWIGYCLGRSFRPSSLLGFHFCCSFSYHACRPTSFHSCHVSPLNLLPPLLGFPDPFTLYLPLITLIDLLAINFAMLAHWVYYLFP